MAAGMSLLMVLLMLSTMLMFRVVAEGEYTEGVYTYTVTDGAATIIKVDRTVRGEIEIPSTLGGYPVTSIKGGSLTHPAAFAGCDLLTTVMIPDSVTNIGSAAFSSCDSLASLVVATGNPVYHSDGNCIIQTADKKLAFGCKNSVIPTDGSVISIGEQAFSGCKSLTSITIPEGVAGMGYEAFYSCDSLVSVTLPGSLKYIGSRVFSDCESLTSVTLSNGITSIADRMFYGCGSLINVVIPNSVTSIEQQAFCDCDSLTAVTIPNSVTSIGDSAFLGCTSLTSITIPDSVTSIGDSALHDTGYYREIKNWEDGMLYVGNHLLKVMEYREGACAIKVGTKTIADRAFFYCTSLTSVTIPDNVTSIGEEAFSGCTSLLSITIPSGVTHIGREAFSGCSSLASLVVKKENVAYHSAGNCIIHTERRELVAGCNNSTIPTDGSVTSIGDGAFSGCSSLVSITIPDGVTNIGPSAFAHCVSLTSITIPNGVTKIGGTMFAGCTSLAEVTVPKSVTIIVRGAFRKCDALGNVYYLGTEADRAAIAIGDGNDCLGEAVWHYQPNAVTENTTNKEESNPTAVTTTVAQGNDEDQGADKGSGVLGIAAAAVAVIIVAAVVVFLVARKKKNMSE